MSPPLDLAMVPGRIAYAISKLGMTLLTHGLAEEVRPHNIAVNSLWPRDHHRKPGIDQLAARHA